VIHATCHSSYAEFCDWHCHIRIDALLALELVIILWARVGVRGVRASEGVEIGVVADDGGVGSHPAGSTEQILDVMWYRRGHGDKLAPEENVFSDGVAGSVGFSEDFSTGAVPVEHASDFGKAAAVAIVMSVEN
jgi:hypothetical protein